MKSPILILFIIFNLLAINLVSASNVYEEKVTESHMMQLADDADSSIGKSACDDHCGHISSHIMGLISHITQPTAINTPTLYFTLNKQFNSFVLSPPSHPPKA